jgi:osmoprotectant transport system ATP-binding protein
LRSNSFASPNERREFSLFTSLFMIELCDLTKQYGPVAAVDGINLRIATGEFLVLAGQSGSGKTTTLSLINRLIEPSRGAVLIDGLDTRSTDTVALRRQIGFVFQDIGLFPHMTIAENVGITPKLIGKTQAEIAARVDEMLTLVRLAPDRFRDALPAMLSGGQRQRAGVARALAASPRVMLMDEPFGALDPPTRDELSADYRRIHDRLGLTTLLVTHDMIEAMLLGDRIALMRDGRIVQIGRPRELITSPADDFVRAMMESPKRRAQALAGIQAGLA